MINYIAKVGMAAMLVAGTLAGSVIPASAQVGVDIYLDGPDRRPPPPPGYGYYRPPGPDYDRPPPRGYGRPRGCDPQLAEDIARDYGLRRAHVVDVSPRNVVVSGFGRRGPDRMYFANVRGCPVVRR